MDRRIQADKAFLKWCEKTSKNVVHIADAWYAAVKWADKTLLDKVYNWLIDRYENQGVILLEDINELKQAMEEQQ